MHGHAGRRLLKPGDAVTQEALFRQEDAAIVASAEAQLTGRVAAAIFLGDRIRLSIGGIGAAPIIVAASGCQSFDVGDTVYLRIAAGALLSL